jgi:glycosyltransferase involved in cell wall biosynthesis
MKPAVVHVITGLQTGGAELMLSRFVARHEQSSFRHVVICLTGEGPTAVRIREAGVPLHILNLRPGLPSPLGIARIARLIRRERAVAVQTWLYHADLLGGLAARLAGRRVAWGVHHSSLSSETTSRNVLLVARLCRLVARVVPSPIILCAESARRAHVDFGYPAKKTVVIPNGFDLDKFHPDPDTRASARMELGIGPSEVLIGIVGRFVPLKNHRLFVEAAARVASDHPQARFVMIGDGLEPGNAELKAWIAATGHADRFLLVGRRSDTPRLLNAMDVVALTSTTEAFPLVIGEAMATAVPCVSTDVGDAALLIGDTGRLVPSGDAVALACAMSELITMPAEHRRKLGWRARQRMACEFEIGKIAERYEESWRSLAAGERPCG